MADKKKMSVADMLAAARKADGGGSGDTPSEPAESAAPDAPPESPSAAPAPPKKIAKPGSADRPGVSDILAMARAGKSGDDKPAATAKSKPAAKPAADKPKPAAAKSKPAAAKASEPRDTASILAAARSSHKPGPMSKAEAAAKSSGATATAAKPKITAPPMPVKPAYAKPTQPIKEKPASGEDRRDFFGSMLAVGYAGLAVLGGIWTFLTIRFMFPNVLREPPSKFKVGTPDDFPAGQVSTKFKAAYNVWIVNTEFNGQQELFALRTVCTHLGCTPNWLEAEQKFKCPCHGSGFYKDGINFEGPAPRPLERYAIQIAADGQVEVDKSRKFQEEMGQWADPACYIPV